MRKIFRFNSLQSKIFYYFLLVSISTILIAFAIIFIQVSKDIKKQETSKLIIMRDLKANSLLNWLEERKGDIQIIASDENIRNFEHFFLNRDSISDDNFGEDGQPRQYLQRYLKYFPDYQELLIVQPETGKVMLSTSKEQEGMVMSDRSYYLVLSHSQNTFIQQIHYSENLKNNTLDISTPIYCLEHRGAHFIGILVARINPDISLYPLLSDIAGLGDTGEIEIVNREGVIQNPLRWYPEANLRLKIDTLPVQKATQGFTGIAEENDYRGVKTISAYTYLPEFNWGFIVKQDAKEIYRSMEYLIINLSILFFIIIILTFFISRILAASITRPIREIARVSLDIQKGNYSSRAVERGSDEVSNLAKTINKTVEIIQSTINISNKRNDVLEHIFSLGSIKEYFEVAIQKLCNNTESQIGVLYRFNRDSQQYEHLTSVGIDKELIRNYSLSYKEGIIGQVLNEKSTIYLKNIPDGTAFAYKAIPANLIPKEIIAFPLILNGCVEVIIVLASIYTYHSDVITIISQTIPQMTITMEKLINEEETIRLSREIDNRNKQLNKLNDELSEHAEELKNQKEEIEHQYIELELQKNEIQEASRLKSEFLSNMSHELRTPLNSIIALSDLLEIQIAEQISEEQKKYLKVIIRNGRNLLNLINDILDLSKIEAGKITILPEHFSLEQIIKQIKEDFFYQAKEKGIGLEIDIQPGLPQIYSDRQKINQILQNLVGNAVKFTEKGLVEIKLNFDEIKGNYSIAVHDTGIGIDKKDIPKIFDEFKQVEGSASRRYEGTGLGLGIVSRLVRILEGEIQVESQPGKGSTFRVLLPKIIDNYVDPLLANTLIDENKKPFDLPKKRDVKTSSNHLLLIEDNEPSISQIQYLLKEEGFHIEVARGGKEALQYLKEEIPGGIILDLMMPGMDGFEVLKKIREDERTRIVPVLVLTAKDLTEEEIKELKYNKIKQLVFKGAVNRTELIEKIKCMLN